MNLLSLVVAAALSGTPMADVSPYALKHLPDGSLEYSYDLSVVKSAGGTADAIAAHGEEKVKAFLKGLPKTLKVTVAAGTPLEVTAGRPLEPGKLTMSFATIADGPMASDNPLANKGGARLRPAFDPDEPRLLLTAEAMAWQVRQIELSALAAEEVDTEALRRDLWNKVFDAALARHKATQGDQKEGALALVARVAAANACLDRSKVNAKAHAEADVSAAIDAEISRLTESPDALVPPQPFSWRPELTCAWVRMRALAQPFERSRAGTAAVLTFLDLLQKDPKLAATWDQVRQRRDRFLGLPATEASVKWKELSKGAPGERIEGLNDFIESMPIDDRVPPPLVAWPETPFAKFLSELKGAERSHAFAELATAVQDGRVVTGAETWPKAQDAALAPFCRQDKGKAVAFDGDWRERFHATFAALVGSAADARGGIGGGDREEAERSELSVRLLVPPALEVEPLGDAFAREAESLEKLVEALQAEKLGGLSSLGADGARGGPIVATARSWIPRLKGLAALAHPEQQAAKEVAEGRRFANAWRSEPALSKDVREVSASPVSMSNERMHAAIVGVGRRELSVSYQQAPKMTLVGGKLPGIELGASEQRYIVPALVSIEAPASAARRPIERSALKSLVEGAQREVTQIEGAFVEAVKAP